MSEFFNTPMRKVLLNLGIPIVSQDLHLKETQREPSVYRKKQNTYIDVCIDLQDQENVDVQSLLDSLTFDGFIAEVSPRKTKKGTVPIIISKT